MIPAAVDPNYEGEWRRFRKKPVVIEARRCERREEVTTLESTQEGGPLIAQPGDWIIRGVKGELYPCRDDIFRETYEPVDEG